MPIVTIHQSPGRTTEQRQILIKRITEAIEDVYNVKPDFITVLFQDYADDYWGMGGLLYQDGSERSGK